MPLPPQPILPWIESPPSSLLRQRASLGEVLSCLVELAEVDAVKEKPEGPMCLTPEMHLGSIQHDSSLAQRHSYDLCRAIEDFLSPCPSTAKWCWTVEPRNAMNAAIHA